MYIKRLDGLRGFAVIMVMWAHFLPVQGSYISSVFVAFGDVVGVGYFGVDLFFVLSGFLITRIMFVESKASIFSIQRFFLKRVLRIFPIYYASITLLFVFGLVPLGEYLSNFFYVSNYFYTFNTAPSPLRHTWSLSVEEQFYIIWPFMFALLGFVNFTRVVFVVLPLIAISSSIFALYWFGEDEGSRFLYRSITSRMLSLSMGAALAIMELKSLLKNYVFRVVAFLVATFSLSGAYLVSDSFVLLSALLKMLGFSLLSFVLVWTAVVGDFLSALQERVLSSKIMVYIGTISYGLYLYHAIILFLLGASEYQAESVSFAVWSMALFLTFAVSALSFEFLEKRIMSLRKVLLAKA